MTQEENPLGGLLGGIEGALGSTAGGGASGGIGSAAGGNAVSQIMGVLEGAPGAGTAQAGQAINPSVLTGVLGMLGGATGAGSTGVGTSGPGTTNVNALVDQLKAGGLASEVESWIGTGANKPVSPSALGQALGPQTVQQLSSSTGLSVQQLLPQLAALIPLLINHLTPGGSTANLGGGSTNEALGALTGLLGGLGK